MKKIFFLLLLPIALSCTKDNNPSNDTSLPEGTILRSYKQGDNSLNGEHFFENNGTRYEKIMRADGSTSIKYVYDSKNRMTKILYEPNADATTVNNTTLFYYNDKDQIIKMEKDYRNPGTSGQLYTWLFTHNGNTVTQELVSDQDPNYNHVRVRYTFNNEGLLISRQNYSDSQNNSNVSTSQYVTFKYDNNKNIILLKYTDGGTHDLPDSPINNVLTNTISYEYDDKVNPLHSIYMNHYMNYILSDDFPFNLLKGSFQDRVAGTGTNNLKRTIYSIDPLSGGVPVDNDYKNDYTYQLNNLPKRIAKVSISNNKEYSYITFNYISK